jgi:protein disulfide-isomerase A1
MHTAQKLALGLLAAAAVASASDVHQLKTDNFDEFIKTNDLVLAECTFPHPTPCVFLLPAY